MSITRGEFGKLNFKYMFRVLLEDKEPFDQYMETCALEVLAARGAATEQTRAIVTEIMRFTRRLCLDFRGDLPSTLERIVALDWDIMGQYAAAQIEAGIGERHETFTWDILRWREDLYARPLDSYATPDGVTYAFYVPTEQQRGLAVRFRQYQTRNLHLTLRKMTEYMRLSDLFYRVRRADAPATV